MFSLRFTFPKVSLRTCLMLLFIGVAAINFAQPNLPELKRGHQGWLETYALSPTSNKYLVTAGNDQKIILWDYATGKQVREIKNQPGILALAISPDDRYFFSADTASRIKKWDLTTGKLSFNIVAHQPIPVSGDEPMGMIDSEVIDDMSPSRWEQIRKRYLQTQVRSREHLSEVIVLDLSADGLWLATAGIDHKIKIWNALTGQLIRNIGTFELSPWTVLFTKDKQHLLLQNVNEVSVYALGSGKKTATFKCDGTINEHHLSIDQQYIYGVSNYSNFQKINLVSGQITSSLKLEVPLFRMVELHNETTLVGLSHRDSTVHFDLKTGKVIYRGNDIQRAMNYQLDQKNQLVFIGDDGKRVLRYDPQVKKITQKFGVFTPDIQQASFSEDGLHILLNDAEMNLGKLDLNHPNQPMLNRYTLALSGYKHHIQLSSDAKKLFATTDRGYLGLWNVDNQPTMDQGVAMTSDLLVDQNGNQPIITAVHFTPNGQQIVLADFLFGLHFVDPQKITDQFYHAENNVEEFNLIQFSKDSNSILVNLIDDGFGEFYELKMKDWTAGGIKNEKLSKKFTVTNIPDRLIQFDFTSDFKFLLYRNEVGEGGIQEVESGQKLLALNNCRFIDWLGTTQQYVLMISQQKVMIWDVANKKISSQYDLPYSPLHADLHPQGNVLLLVRPDQSLELCNAVDGKPLLNLFWQAGTNNFQLKNAEGKIDATVWAKLQTALALKTNPIPIQNVAALSPAFNQKTPNDLDAVILNLGHTAKIVHMSIHNNGKYLWTLDDREVGKVWSLPEGRELRSLSHHMLEKDNRYLRGNALQQLRVHREYLANIWEVDLNTGKIYKTDQEPSKDYFFDSKSPNSYKLEDYDVKTLKFILPDKSVLVKNLSRSYTTRRYLHNAEKKIISVYVEHLERYIERSLISFHGANFQDSTIIRLGNFEFKDLWAWPGTDSLLGKTENGAVYIFHALKKGQTFQPFVQERKIHNLAFSQDQQLVALSLKENGSVEIRRVKDKSLVLNRYFPTSGIVHLAFTPSGENLLLSDGYRIWNWDLKKDSILQFADFYEVNKYYDSKSYVDVLTSGKVVFRIPTEDHKHTYKIANLYNGEINTLETARLYHQLYKSKYQIIVDGSNGNYLDLLNNQPIKLPLWTNSINLIYPARKGNLWAVIRNNAKEFIWWDKDQDKVIFAKSPKVSFYRIAIDNRDSLIALSENNQVWLLDAKTGKEKAIIPIIADSPDRVIMKFSADSRYLFINSPFDGRIVIWDLRSNTLLRTIVLPYSGMEIFNVSTDNQYIYGLLDGWVLAYNLQGKELYRLDLKLRDVVAEYFPDDKMIVAVSNKGVFFQVDAPSGNLLKTLYLGQGDKWILTDQNKQFEASNNAAAYVHYRNKMGNVGYFPKPADSKKELAFEPFPALLKAQKVNSPLPAKTAQKPAGVSDQSFNLVNAIFKTQFKDAKPNAAKIHYSELPFNSPIVSAQLSKDDERIIVQESDGEITFLEKITQRRLKTIALTKPSTVPFILSQNGQYLLAVDGENKLNLYNANTGALLQQKTLENQFVTAIAISANAQVLAVGTLQGFIHILQVPDLNQRQTIRPSNHKITNLAIDPDNKQMVLADLHSNLYVQSIAPSDQAATPTLLGNYSTSGPIYQLEPRPNHVVIARTGKQIFSLQYAESKIKAPNFYLNTQAQWMLIDPVNPDYLYYHDYPVYGASWKKFDLRTFALVDSIQESEYLHALSKDGQLGIVSPNYFPERISFYNLNKRDDAYLPSTSISCTNWDLSGNILHYQSGEGIHRIDLATSKTETIDIQYYYGKFLKEANKYYYVGKFSSPREGLGKKLLGDTSYIWQPGKTPGHYAMSNNGLYLAYWPNNKDSVFVYSSLDYKLVHKFAAPKLEKIGLYLSNNGRYLVVIKGENGFSVFDLSAKKLLFSEDGSGINLVFSKDSQNLINPHPKGARIYDLTSGKVIQTIAYTTPQKKVRIPTSNTRFTLLYSPGGAFQLWDVSKNTYLGDFYFFPLWAGKAGWAFADLDGRYDGNEEGLKNLYTVDENTLKSKTLSLDPGTGYTPGLVSQLIK